MRKNFQVNKQFQSLHINTNDEVDWVFIQKIERDICLLYHQLSNYSFIMGDLYYGDLFNLPYWQFLDIKEIDDDKRKFIRQGSLVFIFAMISDEVEGSGWYLSSNKEQFDNCKRCIEECIPENEDDELLIESIKAGFELIDNKKIEDTSIYDNSTEIHKRFVRRYFEAKANEF